MFCNRPVSRLSAQTTEWPSPSNASHKCDPMKPAPPVTSMRIIGCCDEVIEYWAANMAATLVTPVIAAASIASYNRVSIGEREYRGRSRSRPSDYWRRDCWTSDGAGSHPALPGHAHSGSGEGGPCRCAPDRAQQRSHPLRPLLQDRLAEGAQLRGRCGVHE